MNIEQIIDAGYARCGAETAYGYLAVMDADGCVRVFEADDDGYTLVELLHRASDLPAALELWARPWSVTICDCDGNVIDDLGEEYVFADTEQAICWIVQKYGELTDSSDASEIEQLLRSQGRVPNPSDSSQAWAICRRERGSLVRFGAYENSQIALKS